MIFCYSGESTSLLKLIALFLGAEYNYEPKDADVPK